MPLIGSGIVVDLNRSAKARATVRATSEHHIGAIAIAGRAHARAHVNVVVRGASGAVNRQEYLTCQPCRIDIATDQAATEVDCCGLVECGRYIRVLSVGRADAPKTAPAISAANEKVAITSNVECSPMGRVGKTERTLPGGPAVCGPVEQTRAANSGRAPRLIMETVSCAVGPIYREPLLIAAACKSVPL